jgi:AAA domain
MDVSGIAGAGKSHLLKKAVGAVVSVGKSVALLSPTDASVKDLRNAGFQARTFQGFQRRPERADLIVIDEASMLSVPQMLWLVKHARENDSRVLLIGDSAQHRSVERGDALRILEQSASVRYVELLKTQRQKVPALKAAIEDLKAGRLQAGWEKLEHFGVIKEVVDEVQLLQRAVEQHLEALRAGKTSLMISPRHEEGRKVAAVVRQKLKAEGAIGAEDHAVTVLRRMDLGSEARGDILHYAPGRVIGFHSRTAGGFRPGEKWTVREANFESVTLESNGTVRQLKPSAKGKWDVLVSSKMQVSVGDQIRVTAGFREGKNVFKNNDVAQVREITNTELVLDDGRRMCRDGARIDQGVCITSHASQCRTVDQVVALPDGADAKGWYVSLSRARRAMHVYTRNKTELRQSVMQPGERKSVWELLRAVPGSTLQSKDRMMPNFWATRQVEIVRATEMER